jgi:hypothetical protein
MVKLTLQQLTFVQVVRENPGIKLRPMFEKVGVKYGGGTAGANLKYLLDFNASDV